LTADQARVGRAERRFSPARPAPIACCGRRIGGGTVKRKFELGWCMDRLRHTLQIVGLVVLLLLATDAFISVGTTCYEIGHQVGGNQDVVKKCSIFHGPILGALIRFTTLFEGHGEAVTAAFTVVLAISTLGLWWASLRLWEAGDAQLRHMAQTAEAQAADMQASIAQARKTAALAQNMLATEQRPWVSFGSVEPQDDLSYDANGARISLRFVLANTGRTPAQRVWLSAQSFVMGAPGAADPVSIQEAQITAALTRQTATHRFGHVLFPGQVIERSIVAYVSQQELDQLRARGDQVFFPTVIATIEYEFTFAQGKHITSCIFEVREAPRRGAPIDHRIFRGNLRVDEFFAGTYAD